MQKKQLLKQKWMPYGIKFAVAAKGNLKKMNHQKMNTNVKMVMC